MAKVYARVGFTDRSGTERSVGESFDLPRETDRDKYEFKRLIAEGIVSTSEKAPTSVESSR